MTPSRGVAPAVAARQDRRAARRCSSEQPRDVRDDRRLAAAADAQVADADDRPRQPAPARRIARVPLRAATPPPRRTAALSVWINAPGGRDGRPRGRGRRRRGSSSAITASVLSLAPRLASTSARAAAPSRARRTGSVTQREQRLVELALRLHLNRRAVGEERVGDLLEVLHVRAEDDRLAEDRRLEDVVAAVIDQAAADEHRGGHLIELRQLADRVEHDDVGARLGVDRQLGAPRP